MTSGTNGIDLNGFFGDTSVTVFGGVNNDTFNYNLSDNNARVFAFLGAGDDFVSVVPNAVLAFLFINFGSGNDQLDSLSGPFHFPIFVVDVWWLLSSSIMTKNASDEDHILLPSTWSRPDGSPTHLLSGTSPYYLASIHRIVVVSFLLTRYSPG